MFKFAFIEEVAFVRNFLSNVDADIPRYRQDEGEGKKGRLKEQYRLQHTPKKKIIIRKKKGAILRGSKAASFGILFPYRVFLHHLAAVASFIFRFTKVLQRL